MAGGLKRKRKGRKGAAKKENPCRVCEFGGISHCICPGEKDEMSSTILSDPKVKDRDVYVRLRTLIEAADNHRKVNEFHWKNSRLDAEGVYRKWQEEMERLELVL